MSAVPPVPGETEPNEATPDGIMGPSLGAEGMGGPRVPGQPGGEGAAVPVPVSGEAASSLQGAPGVAKVKQGY